MTAPRRTGAAPGAASPQADAAASAIRLFEDRDYPGWAEVRNANFPEDPATPESVRFNWESIDPARFHVERYIAEQPGTGRVVGTTAFFHDAEMFHPDKYRVHVAVHPDAQRHGIGTRLWQLLYNRLRDRGAILARASVYEGRPHFVAFATRRGFRETRRAWKSILDVGGVDVREHAHRWERVAAQRITITTLAEELQGSRDVLPMLFELYKEASRHMPLPDTPTDPPYELFLRWVVDNPHSLPEGHFLARDGERYVGTSALQTVDEPDALGQALTATDPAYMGRGIAWALKLHTVRYAQQHGYRRIKTWNDTENQPMLSINLRLGFQPQPAWLVMERAFTASDFRGSA